MGKGITINSNESVVEMQSEQMHPLTTIEIINPIRPQLSLPELQTELQTELQPEITIASGNNKKIMIEKDGTYAFKMRTHAIASTPLTAERSKCSSFMKINGQYPNFATSASSGRLNSILGTTNAHIATLKAGDYVEFGSTLSSIYKDKETVKHTNISGYAKSLADGHPVMAPAMSVSCLKLQEFENDVGLGLTMSPQALILKSNTHITSSSEKSLISFAIENSMGDHISIDEDGMITANKDLTLHFGSNHSCVCAKSSEESEYPHNHVQMNVSLVKTDGTEKLLSNSVHSVGVDGQTNSLFTGLAVQMKAGEKIRYDAYASKNTGMLSLPAVSKDVKNSTHFLRCYRSNDDHICGHFDWESSKVNEPEIIGVKNHTIVSSNDALKVNDDNSFSVSDNNFAGNYLIQFQLNAKVDDTDNAGLSKLEEGVAGLAQSWFECSMDNGITWKSCAQSNSSVSVHKRGSQKTLEAFSIGTFNDVNTRYRVLFNSHNPHGELNTKLGRRELIHTRDDDIPSSGSFNIVKI